LTSSVVIVGAGAIGIHLADRLAARGIDCSIVDQTPVAGFSSTRNQGWLQSGAYYAARGDFHAAATCRDGAARIRSDSPQAVLLDIPCYMLFETAAEYDLALTNCQTANILVLPQTMDELTQAHPILVGSPFRFALLTDDHPVDTRVLLNVTLTRAVNNGARFLEASCPHVLTVADGEHRWRVSLGNSKSIDGDLVVVATGPYLPEVLGDYFTNRTSPLSSLITTKVAVLTLRLPPEAYGDVMFTAPRAQKAPNMVPFRSQKGRGLTVCLNGGDLLCDQRGALDDDLPSATFDDFTRYMGYYFPAWISIVDRVRVTAHTYVCQKLQPLAPKKGTATSRAALVDAVRKTSRHGEKHLIGVYPGKFTSAPIVADELVERISNLLPLDERQSAAPHSPGFAPDVALQRYYDTPEWRLTTSNGSLTFESIDL
jgi:glycine/D-amino acid oxidase-like deaminating enzyme